MSIQRTLESAYRAHGSGDIEAARRGYDAVLQKDPDNVDALQLRGLIALQESQFDTAVQLIERALLLAPRHPTARINLALAHRQSGRHHQAAKALQEQLELTPDAHDIRLELGLLLAAAGDTAAAALHLERCARSQPSAYTLTKLAEVRLVRDPAAALEAAQHALAVDARAASAHVAASVAFWKLGRLPEARAAAERALSIDPHQADAHANLGALLLMDRQFAAARAALDTALGLAPGHASASSHSAVVSLQTGDTLRALHECDRALASDPSLVDARFNRADILERLGRWGEASVEFDRLLHLAPDYPYAEGHRFFCRMMSCSWDGHAARAQALQDDVARGKPSVSPFIFLTACEDPALQLRCASDYAQRLHAARGAWSAPAAPAPSGRLVVAFVSADFHAHATAYLVVAVFEALDRERFEWIAVSTGPSADDAYRKRLLPCFDHFIDASGMSDQAVAEMLRARGAAIVVDLKGYTGGGRPDILALRPAPLQVAWLGYPGTTGAPYVDYILADRQVLPEELQRHFSESVVRLPVCYQPNDGRRAIAEAMPHRATLGLPDDGFVFCCFNAAFKITPDVFALWMQILDRVPRSVLWLLDDNPLATRNLQAAAVDRRIDPGRLVFAPRMPVENHLARHRLADLFLDTWPVNAHTTASDALWAGVPVLTKRGRCFASRVAGSLLEALGLNELIADTDADYVDRAVGLADDPGTLQALGMRLAEHRRSGPLFDSEGFARALERAFTTMHQRLLQGQPPAAFEVSGDD